DRLPEVLADALARALRLTEALHVVIARETQREHLARTVVGTRGGGVDDHPRAALDALHDIEDLGPRVAQLLQGDGGRRRRCRRGLRGGGLRGGGGGGLGGGRLGGGFETRRPGRAALLSPISSGRGGGGRGGGGAA